MKRHYPNFEQLLNAVPDHRKRSTYQVAELLSAGLLMFLFRRGSRNQTDQLAGKQFETNYLTLFGMRLPIMDTVHQFLEKLPVEELENLKELLVRQLMERKVFEKWKYDGYYNLSFDGTGVHTFDEEPFEGCPYKETKNHIKWYASVLEAKLVFANGMSFSLATEWLTNQNGKFDKQDCELAAFKRLAVKIKERFPRLGVLVTADGLYPNGPIFDLLKRFNWKFIFTFKDDSLKSIWKQVNQQPFHIIEKIEGKDGTGQWLYKQFNYLNQLNYQKHSLSLVQYLRYYNPDQPCEKHVHLTNLTVTHQNAQSISEQGMMRWKIENEGFNTQKNHGFNLGHKYARKNFNAIKNYYQLMQIAHLISQLTEKLRQVQQLLAQSARTIKAIIEEAMAEMKKIPVGLIIVQRTFCKTKQLRY